MRNKVIQLKTDDKTKELLMKASEDQNIPLGTFVRMSAVQNAKKILEVTQ